MTIVSPRYALCKKCKAITPVDIISSFSTRGLMHTDFYRENYGTQLVCHALSICRNCLFVGRTEEFEIIERDDLNRELLWKQSREFEKLYPPSKRYIMLAERLEKEGGSKMELGNTFLQASWAERMIWTSGERSSDSIPLEKECISRTLKYFREALNIGEMKDTVENLYLMGELFRRVDNFAQAIQFFDKAKVKLKEEKYFCIFLDDPGPERKLISKKIGEMNPINGKKSFFLIDNVPSKILGNLTLEDAEKKVSEFCSLCAKVSIKKDAEIPPDRKKLLNLIYSMERFAEQKDSSGQIIGDEYLGSNCPQ